MLLFLQNCQQLIEDLIKDCYFQEKPGSMTLKQTSYTVSSSNKKVKFCKIFQYLTTILYFFCKHCIPASGLDFNRVHLLKVNITLTKCEALLYSPLQSEAALLRHHTIFLSEVQSFSLYISTHKCSNLLACFHKDLMVISIWLSLSLLQTLIKLKPLANFNKIWSVSERIIALELSWNGDGKEATFLQNRKVFNQNKTGNWARKSPETSTASASLALLRKGNG